MTHGDSREGLTVKGVSRVGDNEKVVLVGLSRRPTDDELRDFHDSARSWVEQRGKVHEISMKPHATTLGDCHGVVKATADHLCNREPSPDYKQAYENEAQKFQQETRRTSEQSRLIDDMIERLTSEGHWEAPHPKECWQCIWLRRAKELRARPINCYCAPNWSPKCPVHGLVETAPTPSQPSEEPVYKAVEKILDEESAWISRPSIEVTKRIALAATIAAKRIIEEIAEAVPAPSTPTAEAMKAKDWDLENDALLREKAKLREALGNLVNSRFVPKADAHVQPCCCVLCEARAALSTKASE